MYAFKITTTTVGVVGGRLEQDREEVSSHTLVIMCSTVLQPTYTANGNAT
jgi:hypothetical protein